MSGAITLLARSVKAWRLQRFSSILFDLCFHLHCCQAYMHGKRATPKYRKTCGPCAAWLIQESLVWLGSIRCFFSFVAQGTSDVFGREDLVRTRHVEGHSVRLHLILWSWTCEIVLMQAPEGRYYYISSTKVWRHDDCGSLCIFSCSSVALSAGDMHDRRASPKYQRMHSPDVAWFIQESLVTSW